MDVGLMIEGQEGVTWDLWDRYVRAAEDLGFESLWRSDHFFSLGGASERPALETFVSLAHAAEHSERIRFGVLVASVTFRHPSLVARMAAQVDRLSGGRFVLGLGAGWNVPEHEAFGIPFPPVATRMDMLQEYVQVVRALWAEGPASFEGEHYRLQDAVMQPKPVQSPMPVVIGGRGERRTLRIVAEHADEWNAVAVDYDGYVHLREVLARHCADAGRDPASIRHSRMAGFVIGRDDADVREHMRRIMEHTPWMGRDGDVERGLARARRGGWYVGTPGEIVDMLGRWEEAGVSRVMMQHHEHGSPDLDRIELLASEVLPQVQR